MTMAFMEEDKVLQQEKKYGGKRFLRNRISKQRSVPVVFEQTVAEARST